MPQPMPTSMSLESSPKFNVWKEALRKAGCKIHKVEPLQVLPKRDGTLLFALIKTDIEDPEGRHMPPIALIRGHACVVVTVVVHRETGERKFLMLRQRRIANGERNLEFPAGMLDEDVDSPVQVAVKEVEEETGLKVRPEDLHALNSHPLFSSPGLDDEAIHYFCCTVILDDQEFKSLEGRTTGLADEDEHIEICLVNHLEALSEVKSLQVRLGFYLYFDFLKGGQT